MILQLRAVKAGSRSGSMRAITACLALACVHMVSNAAETNKPKLWVTNVVTVTNWGPAVGYGQGKGWTEITGQVAAYHEDGAIVRTFRWVPVKQTITERTELGNGKSISRQVERDVGKKRSFISRVFVRNCPGAIGQDVTINVIKYDAPVQYGTENLVGYNAGELVPIVITTKEVVEK